MNEENLEGFEDPIASGKMALLTRKPAEGEPVFQDYFFVEGLNINQEDIKNIILPKFIMNRLNPGVGFSEKGLLLLTLDGNHKNGVYAEVMKMLKNGLEELKIHFYVPPGDGDAGEDFDVDETIISTWSFCELVVQAVDFGYVSPMRPEPAEVSIEFDYAKFEIDGNSI